LTGDPMFFVAGVTVVLGRGEVSWRDMIRWLRGSNAVGDRRNKVRP
jgi:hypothetical protein